VPPNTRDRDYFFKRVDTSLKGTDMLGKQLNVEKYIGQFIELRLNAKKP
jgi:hypothetical protein